MAHPDLNEMQALFDTIAHTHRHAIGPPEGGECITRQPEIGRFIKGDSARMIGFEIGIMRHIARGEIGRPSINSDGANIGRMDGL
jgi:hypothetical protein